MAHDDIVILNGDDALSILTGRELEIMDTVADAYKAHARGDSSLPHSSFLRFQGEPMNRIIALPAFLGGDFQAAGIKWIASFPGNRDVGMDRASAVLILNSTATGRPEAIIEGSVISAKRTAAGAVLAARYLRPHRNASSAGVIGCGLINYEIVRFILADRPETKTLAIFDTDTQRATKFREKVESLGAGVEVVVAKELQDVLRQCPLISVATTAIEPHIADLSCCAPATAILHVSLRDLTPEVILAGDNIVDDISHVCRAQTSVHLAEQLTGNRDFIRCTLGDLLLGNASERDGSATVIFSPFGLGILDIAVAKLVYDRAREQGRGTVIRSFLPDSWTDRLDSVRDVALAAPGLHTTGTL